MICSLLEKEQIIRCESQRNFRNGEARVSLDGLVIGGRTIVTPWERNLQEALVRRVVKPKSSVLEIGYGLGLASQEILSLRPKRYVIVEAHPFVCGWARRAVDPNKGTVVENFWQNLLPPDERHRFEAAVYDPYPVEAQQPFDGSAFMTLNMIMEFVPNVHQWVAPKGRMGFLDFSCELANHPGFLRAAGELNLGVSVFAERISPVACSYAWRSTAHIIVVTV
jgi:SAM-dependent methyltransferase